MPKPRAMRDGRSTPLSIRPPIFPILAIPPLIPDIPPPILTFPPPPPV